MTVQPNGTDAKDIALYFVKVTSGRATSSIVAKTINQAKSLLASGYTKEEIIKVIDRIISKGTDMYSLGYVSTCINKIIREIESEEKKQKVQQQTAKVQEAIAEVQKAERKEVVTDGESSQRNRDKSARIGVQSGFREKFNFDMFEKQ